MSLWNDNEAVRIVTIIITTLTIIGSGFFIAYYIPLNKVTYTNVQNDNLVAAPPPVVEEVPKVTHIATPESVRAVYLTSWAAGSQKFRDHLFDLVDNTEINSVVIDIKDYTGKISFPVKDPELMAFGSSERRIPDIEDFIRTLHEKNVYVIGRISAFQDSYLINDHPEWAVKTMSGEIWKDYKGVKWLDVGAKPVWDYLVRIGNESYSVGFDELNFDYIRFPSDGNMRDIAYSWSGDRPKSESLREFFQYINMQYATSGIPTSADLFGLTTSASGDLGIGQILEDALLNFDYVAPMVYPSHFNKGYMGIALPAQNPYDVINHSMSRAVVKANMASTSPAKLRPWLQAFDLGAVYTPELVRAQIQATYDVGLNSWMLWNAGSVYKKDALLPKEQFAASTTSPSVMSTYPQQ